MKQEPEHVAWEAAVAATVAQIVKAGSPDVVYLTTEAQSPAPPTTLAAGAATKQGGEKSD